MPFTTVTFTVTIDHDQWATEYTLEAEDVPADVAAAFRDDVFTAALPIPDGAPYALARLTDDDDAYLGPHSLVLTAGPDEPDA